MYAQSKYYILVKGNKKPSKILKSLLHVCKSDTNKTNHLNVEIYRCELKNKPSCCESKSSFSTFHLLSYCFKTVFVFFFFFIFLFKSNSRVFFQQYLQHHFTNRSKSRSVSKLWKAAVIIQTNFNLPQQYFIIYRALSKAWDKRGRFCTGGWNHLEINFISQECLLKLNKFIATVSYKYPYNCYIYFYRIAFFLIIMS